LHTVADFLEELIMSSNIAEDSKSKALKVLFSLGLLRGSLPNLLSVVNLLRKNDLKIDLVTFFFIIIFNLIKIIKIFFKKRVMKLSC